MMNVTNELCDAHKKRKSWTRTFRNSWRSYKTWLTGKYKMH
jgi:hypothetical protein